jgi:hypothetical protein
MNIRIVMGYGLDSRGSIPSRDKNFVFSMASRLALGPTQHSVQWVQAPFALEIKWLQREAGCSVTCSANIRTIVPIPVSCPS